MSEGTCKKCGKDVTGGHIVYKGFQYHYTCFAEIIEASQCYGLGAAAETSSIAEAKIKKENPDINLYALSIEIAALKKQVEELRKLVSGVY